MKTDLAGTDIAERAEEVRKSIELAQNKIEKGYAEMAQLLHETWENGYFVRWGYENFKDYCEAELGWKYRRAMYFVAIAEVVKKMEIPWEDVEGIGWTKMRTLLPILEEQGEVGDWLEIAQNYSVKALQEMVGDAKLGSDIGRIGDPDIATLTFRLTQDQFDIINEALGKAKKVIDNESNSLALEQMAYDYFMAGDELPEQMPLSGVLDWIERSYGVTVEATGPTSMEGIVDGVVKEQKKQEILNKNV